MRPPVAASSPRSRYLKNGRRPGAYGVVLTKDLRSFIAGWTSVSTGVSGLFMVVLLAKGEFIFTRASHDQRAGRKSSAPFTKRRGPLSLGLDRNRPNRHH